MTGPDVDEVDVESVDLGRELRERIELRLGPAPVVPGPPMPDELLQPCELDALRPVIDRLTVGPPRRRDAPAEILDLLFGDIDPKGADRVDP